MRIQSITNPPPNIDVNDKEDDVTQNEVEDDIDNESVQLNKKKRKVNKF